MSLRQPRTPRMAAGLRQPAPGQLVKEPQGENAIPDSTSWSPSARKTEAGQNRGSTRGWGATDPHSSIIGHALLRTEPSPGRGQHRDPCAGYTGQRPPGLQVCGHSFRIRFQNLPESKTHQTLKLPGHQGPGAGSGEDQVETPHTAHTCACLLHTCHPFTQYYTGKRIYVLHTHPRIHSPNVMRVHTPHALKYT